jgi:hypothetical protein
VLLVAALATAAQEPPQLRHPAVHEVVSMLEAGLGEEVILARVAQLRDLPTLSGDTLAALKTRGASDRMLLVLVDGGDAARAPAAAGTDAWLRVVVAPSFPVTQLGVSVDGQTVATRGVLPQGESEPGRILRQPRQIPLDEPLVVWEGEAAAGAHLVQLGFGVARVEVDPDDIWLEYSRQTYAASGVLLPGQPPRDGWQTGQAAVCTLAVGQVCEVVARLDKRSPTRFGGLPAYFVSYAVSPLEPRR